MQPGDQCLFFQNRVALTGAGQSSVIPPGSQKVKHTIIWQGCLNGKSSTLDCVVSLKDPLWQEELRQDPWQRMKWSDSMVRLLITMVLYVGEDGGSECEDGSKNKSGILQKKGKWKSVSKVMMGKGCYVSPQQCEDKFNDLNKRYKRLNDILGRGIACRVVENPSLLDSMEHLSPKVKEDVRKILSSKHLFFKEMCAYHNGTRVHFPADLDVQ